MPADPKLTDREKCERCGNCDHPRWCHASWGTDPDDDVCSLGEDDCDEECSQWVRSGRFVCGWDDGDFSCIAADVKGGRCEEHARVEASARTGRGSGADRDIEMAGRLLDYANGPHTRREVENVIAAALAAARREGARAMKALAVAICCEARLVALVLSPSAMTAATACEAAIAALPEADDAR